MRHLVDRDPEAEVAAWQREAAFGLDDVRADEVEHPLVVGREEHVVLPEHLPRDVPEQQADLRAERLPAELRPTSSLGHQLAGEGFEQPLERPQVGADPFAPRHHPGAGASAVRPEAREVSDQGLGQRNELGQILAQPGALDRRGAGTRSANAATGLGGSAPVDEDVRTRTHRPVDGGGLHGRR
jgi:hypothetical protein